MGVVNLDHMSANPLIPEVQDAMIAAIKAPLGNPSSQHQLGESAALLIDDARQAVATMVNAAVPREIVFTSGGTESVNMAIKGVAWAFGEEGKGKHIVTCNTEHNAVIRSLRRLKQMGYSVTSVPVDEYGRVNPDIVARAIKPDTILVSIMHSNNEIGTIQPVKEIAAVCKSKKVLYHCDAVDSVGVVPVDVQDLGVDLLSFASNTFYGPVGVGGLYVRRGVPIWPLFDGGVQENRKRAGMENLIGIAGMGAAAKAAIRDMEKRIAHAQKLKELFLAKLPEYVTEYGLNGHPEFCLPGLVSLSVKHVEGESVVLMLDDEGFAVSTRSACASGSLRASHVLLSTGLGFADCQGTMVITFGIDNTEDDVMRFLASLKNSVITLREISPLYKNGQVS